MTTNRFDSRDRPPRPAAYSPITAEDLQKPARPAVRDSLAELKDPVARCLAVPLFIFIFDYAQKTPLVAPALILVLIGCLFSRMDGYARQVAAVPLTLSAIKLAFGIGFYLQPEHLNAANVRGMPSDPGFLWLPMFFSACLVFIPRKESVTFKIVFVASCLLLASGLLPGDGFVGIFYLLDVLLFLAIVAGIVIDLATHAQKGAQPHPLAAQ